jgi:hypothetical protein
VNQGVHEEREALLHYKNGKNVGGGVKAFFPNIYSLLVEFNNNKNIYKIIALSFISATMLIWSTDRFPLTYFLYYLCYTY